MKKVFLAINGTQARKFMSGTFELVKGNITARQQGTESEITVTLNDTSEKDTAAGPVVEKEKIKFSLEKAGDANGKGSVWKTVINDTEAAENQSVKALKIELNFLTTKTGTFMAYETAAATDNQNVAAGGANA
jgi:hypothetical protein